MGHTLSRHERSAYAEDGFVCNLCQEEGCGPLYHCSDCDYDVHVHCAAIEKQQTHFTHPQHPLHLTHRSSQARVCDSCGSNICRSSFRCDICDFDMHPRCVRAPQCLLHPRHPHPLVLLQHLSDVQNHRACSGCVMPVTKLSYHCGMCAFTLHPACATLPSKVKHLKHTAHVLALLNRPPQELLANACGECGDQVQGWHFGCTDCNFNLHPVCANLEHDYLYGNIESLALEQNTLLVLRNVQDGSHESTEADRSSSPSPTHRLVSRSTGSERNSSHENSNASTAPTKSVETDRSATPLFSHSASQIPFPCKEDWEAVQRVLQFAQGMAKVSMSSVAQDSTHSPPDDGHCLACHKGYDCWNPKFCTSCGHHFHLACALDCMKTSDFCPICRKTLKISMSGV